METTSPAETQTILKSATCSTLTRAFGFPGFWETLDSSTDETTLLRVHDAFPINNLTEIPRSLFTVVLYG